MNAICKAKKLRLLSIMLMFCMVVTLFSSMSMTAQAAGKIDAKYWIEAAELETFGMAGSKTVGKIKFGLNGSDARVWAICGTDGGDLVLLSTTGFATGKYGATSEYSKSFFVEDLRNADSLYLGANYFSLGELDKMQPVTVNTEEPDTTNGGNHTVSVEDMKLYLPNSESPWSWDDTIIYVGRNNDIPVDLKTHMVPTQGFQETLFWLRSPEENKVEYAHVAYPDIDVNSRYVLIANSHYVVVMPALNLNLSTVLFASAADAAAGNGFTASSAMKENTYTLRYQSSGSEIAEISADGSKVSVKDAKDMYLVAQSDAGVYTKRIETESETVAAADMSAASGGLLDDFNDCEVWIESTTDRITTAKAAGFDHDLNTDWSSDATDHWHECIICGDKNDIEEHTWNAPAATEDHDKHCVICEYVAEGQLTHTHSGSLVNEKEPTFTTDGNIAYYMCSCGVWFKDAACNEEIADHSEVILPHLLYEIIEGKDGVYTKGSGQTLTVKANGPEADCTGVKVDGAFVDATNYTKVSGSTIITLKNNYLETLGTGNHSIIVVYGDREEATANFKVQAASQGENSGTSTGGNTGGNTDKNTAASGRTSPPQTGEVGNGFLWIALLLLSCSGIVATCVAKEKRARSK